MEPLKIVERKGLVAYRLALLDSFRRTHDVFNVSVLRHYISDPTHVIDMSSLQELDEGMVMVDSIQTLDHHIRKLRCRRLEKVNI
jgi:hypothetical protein